MLQVNNSDQSATEINISSLQESTSLMQQSVEIQPNQTDKTTELAVASTFWIHYPIAIIVISMLQLMFHLDDCHDDTKMKPEFFSKLARILLFTSENKLELWRFLTYMFVHKDRFHLGVNIVFQLLGGVPLEMLYGWWRLTIIYLAGVLGGSLGIEAISKCEALVGASAGVYSILGAHVFILVLNWREIEYRAIWLFILIVYVLTDFFSWMCIPQLSQTSDGPICIIVSELTDSTITHFCGFMFGILTAILILKNNHGRSCRPKIQLISVIVLVSIISLAVCLMTFLPKFNINKMLFKSLKDGQNFNSTFDSGIVYK